MSETVLVTGGFGLVGSATLKRLAADGRRVVATDLGTPAQRKAARALPAGAQARWADLTDPAAVDRLVSEVSPAAIVHLAAVIPPLIYRDVKSARKVNVDATAALVRAAARQPSPPRFIQASSNAVYGPRNPHHLHDVERADTPPRPYDMYGATKLEAEELGAVIGLGMGGAAAWRCAERRPEGHARSVPTVWPSRARCRPTAESTQSMRAT